MELRHRLFIAFFGILLAYAIGHYKEINASMERDVLLLQQASVQTTELDKKKKEVESLQLEIQRLNKELLNTQVMKLSGRDAQALQDTLRSVE